jgi:2-iminobutanoate/2-iminopropanoate deaminase
MEFIETKNAPLPRGHYSQAVVSNGFVFVAGILPIIPNTEDRRVPEGIKSQVTQIFKNLEAILAAANSNIQKLVSVQIFIPDMIFWSEINSVYQEIMGDHKPARTLIPCGTLNSNALIELNAVAEVFK